MFLEDVSVCIIRVRSVGVSVCVVRVCVCEAMCLFMSML